MNSITSLEDIEPGDLLMLHSTVAATPEHPEGRRQNIRIDGFVPDAEELYDPDPECFCIKMWRYTMCRCTYLH